MDTLSPELQQEVRDVKILEAICEEDVEAAIEIFLINSKVVGDNGVFYSEFHNSIPIQSLYLYLYWGKNIFFAKEIIVVYA